MSTPFQQSLRQRARSSTARIALPETHDERILAGAAELLREGLVVPVLVGDRSQARETGGWASLSPDDREILDARAEWEDPAAFGEANSATLLELRGHRGMTPEEAEGHARDPVMAAALSLRAGRVDGVVAGADHPTAHVLRSALWCVGTAPGMRTVSSSFYMAFSDLLGGGPGVLTYADGAVVPDPDAEQLADIAVASVAAHRAIVGTEPRVAFLSYSTRGSAGGPSVDRVRSALATFRERLPDVPADGELQLDAAILPGVSERKAPDSPVEGRANILIFPDLDAGNIGYKLTQRLAGAAAVGPILQGLRRPVNDLSRGCSTTDVVEVACITGLLAGAD